MDSQEALLSADGSMRSHSFIAQVNFESRYSVFILCHDGFCNKVFSVLIIAMDCFPSHDLLNMNVSLSMSINYG